ncbi:hypothetical protein PA25_38220 [Pseudoalteromonas sp. A25]|nr:hypothetical protein PA25_38220 [Pseudoalteromonas sp. A25]
MSIIMDIFVWLLIDTVFGFWFYSTGWFLLKVFSFGRSNMELKDFANFKDSKSKSVISTMVLGISFYVFIITLIVYANS